MWKQGRVTREVYIERNFRSPALAMIADANAIIAEYREAGFRLTLRQLYYQHVARGLLANTLKNYKLLSRTMVYARDAGISDWTPWRTAPGTSTITRRG